MSCFVTVERIKGFHKGSLASCPSFLSFTTSCPQLYLLCQRFLPTGVRQGHTTVPKPYVYYTRACRGFPMLKNMASYTLLVLATFVPNILQ